MVCYDTSMSKSNRRRGQRPKGKGLSDERYVREIQELRRSGAAGPHRTATDYRRKPKHFKGWE